MTRHEVSFGSKQTIKLAYADFRLRSKNGRYEMALQIVLFLVPYALALLMPSWKWLLAYAATVALLVAAIWYVTVTAPPTRTGLEGISLAIALSAAVSAAAGTIVRLVTFTARARLVVVTVSVLGAILLTVSVLVWANR
jgi:hypothetical protein